MPLMEPSAQDPSNYLAEAVAQEVDPETRFYIYPAVAYDQEVF